MPERRGWSEFSSTCFDIQMPNYKHQSGEYHRQQGARQLVDLDHLSSPKPNAFTWENAVPVN